MRQRGLALTALRITTTFGALRHPAYRIFWAGSCTSFIGTWIQNVAIGLYIYDHTGSKQALGAVGLASGIPTTALLLFGGVLADRVDKRRLLFLTQSLYALNALALAGLAAFGRAETLHVVIVSFVNGLIFAIDGPTRQAFVYDLVGPEDLATGVALQSASFNAARIIGPALGSVVYVTLGAEWCFLTNAASFGAVLIALALVRTPQHTSPGRSDGISALGGVRASLGYLRTSQSTRTILLLTAAASVFGMSVYQTLMPAIALDSLGISESDTRYGLLFSAIGVGSLIGAYIVGRNADAGRRGLAVFGGAAAFAVSLLALSQIHVYTLALLVLTAVGMAAVTQLATANTLTQVLAPDGMRARAVSLHMFAMGGLQPFGALMAGTIGQRYGVSMVLMVGAIALLMVTVLLAVRRPDVVRLA